MNNEAGIASAEALDKKLDIEIGQVFKFWTDGRSIYQLREGFSLRDGDKVLEVEIKSIKTAKLILE